MKLINVFMLLTLVLTSSLYGASIRSNHFEGGRNLTDGSRYGTGGTLAELVMSAQDGKANLSGASFTGDVSVAGTIVGDKDNASSFRVKGLQHSSEGVAKVQSYAGIFTNAAYNTRGTLKTRAIFGANLEMDLEFQSPHALLLTAVDGSQTDGVIKLFSQNATEIHSQAAAEELSPKRLVIDRVSTAAKGAANTSDVTLGTNSGKLYLQTGHVGGGVVYKCYTDAERNALTPVQGEFICNATTGLLNWYNGTAWRAISDAAI